MLSGRPDGREPGSTPGAPPVVSEAPPDEVMTRFECVNCGAHAVGLLARATRGGWCSTCGSHDLVPIEALPPAPAKPRV